jgi:hypothetical protein
MKQSPRGAGSHNGGLIGWFRHMSTSDQIVAAIIGAVITGFFAVLIVFIQGSAGTHSSPVGPDASERGSGGAVSSSVSASNGTSGTLAPTFSPSSQGTTLAVPASYLGLWQGTLTENSNGQPPQPVNLTLTGGRLGTVVGHSSYPTVTCDGGLTLESSLQAELTVAETYNNGQCLPDTMVLTLKGSQLEISIYLSGPSGTPDWSGTLSRVTSFS